MDKSPDEIAIDAGTALVAMCLAMDPSQISALDVRELLVDTKRESRNGQRPPRLELAVHDELVKALKHPPDTATYAVYLVVVGKAVHDEALDALRRDQSPIEQPPGIVAPS